MSSAFSITSSPVSGGTTVHRLVDGTGHAVPFRRALELLRDDAAVGAALSAAIAAAAPDALFWECVPVRADTLDRQPFEFALVPAPALSTVSPSPSAFQSHFAACEGAPVCDFANLGRDAELVVPLPQAGVPADAYTHIARFVRAAPEEQRAALWRRVGERALAVVAERGERTSWVSTSGLGVYWLHVRVDTRPKYYTHTPYRDPAYAAAV